MSIFDDFRKNLVRYENRCFRRLTSTQLFYLEYKRNVSYDALLISDLIRTIFRWGAVPELLLIDLPQRLSRMIFIKSIYIYRMFLSVSCLDLLRNNVFNFWSGVLWSRITCRKKTRKYQWISLRYFIFLSSKQRYVIYLSDTVR